MVAAMSLMFPAFFGGEGGISGNRVTGPGLFGITYGPQRQMYYLIAGWGFVCIVDDVRADPDAARPHGERGARQPGARTSSSGTTRGASAS